MKLSVIVNEINKEVEEGGFSRTAASMRGLNPKIKTIVILTAENPCGSSYAPDINKDRNSKLEKFLASSLYGYRKVKGQYGSLENSFMVNNMTKGMALKLGNQFEQDTIIYAERFEEDGKYGMVFQMIKSFNCDGSTKIGDVVGERKVFINRENADDFYSELKGRRFQIPFFDVEDEKGSTDYSKSSWDGGKIAGSVYTDKPDEISPEDNEKIDRLVAESLNETKTQKYQWERRGMIINILKKYFN